MCVGVCVCVLCLLRPVCAVYYPPYPHTHMHTPERPTQRHALEHRRRQEWREKEPTNHNQFTWKEGDECNLLFLFAFHIASKVSIFISPPNRPYTPNHVMYARLLIHVNFRPPSCPFRHTPLSPLPSPLSPLHLLTLRARYSMLILPPHAHPFATMPTINQAGGSSSGAVSNPSYEETQAPGRPVPVPAARPSSMAPPPQVMMRPPGLGARYSGRRSSLSDV